MGLDGNRSDGQKFAVDMARMNAQIANSNAGESQKKAFVTEQIRDSRTLILAAAIVSIPLIVMVLWLTQNLLVLFALIFPAALLLGWKLSHTNLNAVRDEQLKEFMKDRETK